MREKIIIVIKATLGAILIYWLFSSHGKTDIGLVFGVVIFIAFILAPVLKKLVMNYYEKSLGEQTSETKQQSNNGFIICVLGILFLLMVILTPILFLYTPLREGIAKGEEILVVCVLEVILGSLFVVIYINLRNSCKQKSSRHITTKNKKKSLIPFLAVPAFGSLFLYYLNSYDYRFLLLGIVFVFLGYKIHHSLCRD